MPNKRPGAGVGPGYPRSSAVDCRPAVEEAHSCTTDRPFEERSSTSSLVLGPAGVIRRASTAPTNEPVLRCCSAGNM